MPIYEFYCAACHTLFSFLARKSGVRKKPACPHCGLPRMRRKPSSFAISRGLADSPREEELPEIDDERMAQAIRVDKTLHEL